jgi:hypothetical protein
LLKANRSRNPRADERQYLPMRCLYQHRGGDPAGDEAAMIGFEYSRAADVADALRQMTASSSAKFIAGGTNLVDLMRMDVEQPAKLIDISRLPLDRSDCGGRPADWLSGSRRVWPGLETGHDSSRWLHEGVAGCINKMA